ncbi:MAG TPA: ABC transporter permease subunit [Steroidobacteraceae bacterium]|nr:ABC transporter permease subunit [Steroidobacteraceae bacterium]
MRARSVVSAAMGCVLLLCAWQLVGHERLLGDTFPAITEVLRIYHDAPRRALLMRSLTATVGSAGAGYGVGLCLGVLVALIAHLAPLLRAGLDRMAVLVNALPVIALAPVLIITAGREDTPTALAAVPVFFLIYTATGIGLRSAGLHLEEVLTTLGANRWQRLLKIEAIAALPQLASGMKIATSSAVIGAIVGEWFGAPSGLGVVVLNSMQNFQIPLLWATVIVIAAITICGYAVLSLGERAVRRRFSGETLDL